MIHRAEHVAEQSEHGFTGRHFWAVIQEDGWIVAEMYEPNSERHAKVVAELLNEAFAFQPSRLDGEAP